MTLTTSTLSQIENIIKSAKYVDISSMIIEKNQIRGINSSKTSFMLSDIDLPDDFETIAISRPDVYLSRFNLIKDIENYTCSTKIKEKGEESFVEQIDFQSKSLKMQYRCSNPSMISAPKVINDTQVYTVKFTQDDVSTLLKASATIDTENIKIIGSDNGLSYKLTDMTGDTIDSDSDSQVECEQDNFNFSFNFVQKPFLQLLKNCDGGEFSLGKKGILEIRVNDINFYLLPQV